MSEIIKLYKNAGIKPIAEYCKHQCNDEFDDDACIGCVYIEKVEYPPFTPEKQIELIKWLAIHKSSYGLQYFGKQWTNCCEFEWENFEECSEDADFEQSLSGLINIIWQSLSEEEKQQVKNILEEVE